MANKTKRGTLYIYIGKMGAGKTFCSNAKAIELKSRGYDTANISLAQPLKYIARQMGFDKYSTTMKDNEYITDSSLMFRDVGEVLNKVVKEFNTLIDKDKIDMDKATLIVEELRQLQYEKRKLFDLILISDNKAEIANNIKQIDRKALQIIGTELFRDCFNENFWANIAVNKIKLLVKASNHINILIDDCRFVNELKELLKLKNIFLEIRVIKVEAGSNVRAARLGYGNASYMTKANEHSSEIYVDELFREAIETAKTDLTKRIAIERIQNN